MTLSPPPTNHDELIERIVREVIRRLLAMGGPPIGAGAGRAGFVGPAKVSSAYGSPVAEPSVISDRLITAATLHALPTGTTEARIAARAIVTPLARDEAKELGIRLVRDPAGSNGPTPGVKR